MDRNYHPPRFQRSWLAPHNSDDRGYATSRARRPNIITSPSPAPSSILSHSGDDRDFPASPSPCPSSEPIDSNSIHAFDPMHIPIQQEMDGVAPLNWFTNGTSDPLPWPSGRSGAQHMNPFRYLPDARPTGQGSSPIMVTEASDMHPSIHVALFSSPPAFRTVHSDPLIYSVDNLGLHSPVSNGLSVSPRSYAPPSPQHWNSYPSSPSSSPYMTAPHLEQPGNSGMHRNNTGYNYDGRGYPSLGPLSQDIFEPRPLASPVEFHLESVFLKCLNDYIAQRYPASLQKPEHFINLGDIRADINKSVLDKCPALGYTTHRYRLQVDAIFARFKMKVGSTAIRKDRDKQKRTDQTHWCPFVDCGGVFTRSNGLKNHLAAHFDLKETVCKTCNKPLRGASSARHMATCGKDKG